MVITKPLPTPLSLTMYVPDRIK